MTLSSSVAYSELTRVLPWAIRARGYAFGTADRASFLVANAASMTPGILGDIAALADRAGAAPRLCRGEGGLTVDAPGISWLEMGPAVMDYCGAHADEAGCVRCHVTGATEDGLLPAVLLVGADYGLSGAALTTADGTLRWTLLGWSEEAGAPRPLLLTGTGRASLQEHLPDSAASDALPGGSDGVHLLAWRGPAPALRADATGVTDATACIEAAFSGGIPIAPDVLEALYELEKITWAPTSERSRAQAGFQPKPAGA